VSPPAGPRDIFPKPDRRRNLRIGLEARTDGIAKFPPEDFLTVSLASRHAKTACGDLPAGSTSSWPLARALAGILDCSFWMRPARRHSAVIIKTVRRCLAAT